MNSNTKKLLNAITVAGLFCLSACAGTFKHEINFNPSEPYRVAVLPFAEVDSSGEIIDANYNLFVDNIPLVSSKLQESPANFVQSLVQRRLSKSGLDLVAPRVVEAKISHAGLRTASGLDVRKVFGTDPKALCELLFCDALVYGRVTKWDRSYYALQTVSTVGVDLKMVSAADGKILFSSQAKDSDSRGLTKGPTGISSVVLEPIRGLDNQIILDLASNVVDKMLRPLDMKAQSELLKTPPPAIVASAHDCNSGVLNRNNPLTVVLLGNPKKQASFSIGGIVEHIPMVEKDDGHYIGQYYPLATDKFKAQPVHVFLKDEFGRVSEQKLGRGDITIQ